SSWISLSFSTMLSASGLVPISRFFSTAYQVPTTEPTTDKHKISANEINFHRCAALLLASSTSRSCPIVERYQTSLLDSLKNNVSARTGFERHIFERHIFERPRVLQRSNHCGLTRFNPNPVMSEYV